MLYRDAAGAWEDFALVEKLLDMVFTSDLELLVTTYAVEGARCCEAVETHGPLGVL